MRYAVGGEKRTDENEHLLLLLTSANDVFSLKQGKTQFLFTLAKFHSKICLECTQRKGCTQIKKFAWKIRGCQK